MLSAIDEPIATVLIMNRVIGIRHPDWLGFEEHDYQDLKVDPVDFINGRLFVSPSTERRQNE